MSYKRVLMGFGDPVTMPSEVDGDSVIVGTVKGQGVPCSDLPADSPWKRPGQVCAPVPWFGEVTDGLKNLWDSVLGLKAPTPIVVAPAPHEDPETPTVVLPEPAPIGPKLLLIAAAGFGGYYLMQHYKKKRS